MKIEWAFALKDDRGDGHSSAMRCAPQPIQQRPALIENNSYLNNHTVGNYVADM